MISRRAMLLGALAAPVAAKAAAALPLELPYPEPPAGIALWTPADLAASPREWLGGIDRTSVTWWTVTFAKEIEPHQREAIDRWIRAKYGIADSMTAPGAYRLLGTE